MTILHMPIDACMHAKPISTFSYFKAMHRHHCKIKSVNEIKTLDNSCVCRLCSASLLERREVALREVFRAAQ